MPAFGSGLLSGGVGCFLGKMGINWRQQRAAFLLGSGQLGLLYALSLSLLSSNYKIGFAKNCKDFLAMLITLAILFTVYVLHEVLYNICYDD